MKIFSASQVRTWDLFTIQEQSITSLQLMERAASACYQWMITHNFCQQPIDIFCGKGNNGGDGLALARLLLHDNIEVRIFILELGNPGSSDFQVNLQKLHLLTTDIRFIQSTTFFPEILPGHLVIDALFGTGLNKNLGGVALQLVEHINSSGNEILGIDMPTGLFADKSTMGATSITATHTLSFQNYKLAFLMPENDKYAGQVHLLDIGLSKEFELAEPAAYEIPGIELIKNIIKPRNKFAHKGDFGHAALLAGSYGMMGAAVMAARACLSSGAGKLTCYVPSTGVGIMQVSVPEAMCKATSEADFQLSVDSISGYTVWGIGPGLGKTYSKLLEQIFESSPKSCVLDADVLNEMAIKNRLLTLMPKCSLITPHPGEFERLFGSTTDNFAQLQLAIDRAAKLGIYIVLKGHYTAIITPHGKVYFNSTGNPGMAKGGMGDVLTGLLTGLMCQGYPLPEAALLGAYLHGLSGDIAAEKFTENGMQASDLIDSVPEAWKLLSDGSA